MGTLRFVLALLVLFSHAGGRFHGLNPGVMAVVVFYIVSGYVMAALVTKHFSGGSTKGAGLHAAGRFYFDRVLRLYPQYVFYAATVALWLYTVGHPTLFLNPPAQPGDWVNNALIVPLNFYMFNAADRFTLVPPAWSLGAEVLFYLLLPWLMRSWRLTGVLVVLSLAVQVLAWHGVLHPDWWGYRLLPGVLWLFVLGMTLFRWQQHRPRWAQGLALGVVPLAGVLAWQYLGFSGHLMQPYHREVLLGLAIGAPLVHLLTRRVVVRGWVSTFDMALGNLSYGIFLNHFLFIWCLGLDSPATVGQWLALVSASVLASFTTYHILERPVLHWRRRRRLARIQA